MGTCDNASFNVKVRRVLARNYKGPFMPSIEFRRGLGQVELANWQARANRRHRA